MEMLLQRMSDEGGCRVLVKDRVACKGTFLLHHLLRKLLTESSTRVVLLGLSDPFTHYNRIARKQGCNLQTWRDNGKFVFIELDSQIFETSCEESGHDRHPLAALFWRIRDVAKAMPGKEQMCIMIDDVSILDIVAGGSSLAVLDFLHYCRVLFSSLLLLTHQDIYQQSGDSYMGLELEHVSDLVLRVEPLSTGLATDVHGQLTMLSRVRQSPDEQRQAMPKIQRFQFRVMESSVQFFRPGHQSTRQ